MTIVRLPGKRPKYNNVPTVIDGYRFASKREAARYEVLKLRVAAKEIFNLEARKAKLRWPLIVHGVLICTYEADFSYVLTDGAREVVEDVKGFKTAEYRIKKKLMKACYRIEIQEV